MYRTQEINHPAPVTNTIHLQFGRPFSAMAILVAIRGSKKTAAEFCLNNSGTTFIQTIVADGVTRWAEKRKARFYPWVSQSLPPPRAAAATATLFQPPEFPAAAAPPTIPLIPLPYHQKCRSFIRDELCDVQRVLISWQLNKRVEHCIRCIRVAFSAQA
jgi:hypothetical protein